ncbi:MAG: DUF5117 domain-containing protein, partial [Cyclobacteriaceae bacterium]|nr:DUF5117 domain-containing protein [Cyclobacteriaceae bacterium]
MKKFTQMKLKSGLMFLLMLGMVFVGEDAFAQKKKKKDSKNQPAAAAQATPPPRPQAPRNGIKPYSEVITAKAKSKEGLFSVHEIDGKYFYEIPDSLIGREMLMVTTIAKTADGIGYGGERTNTLLVRWDKNGDNVLLKVVSYSNTAADSLPIFTAVKSSNLEPILQKFDVKAKAKDDKGVVIEVTDLFSKDVQAIGLPRNRRTQYKVTRLDNERSYIER